MNERLSNLKKKIALTEWMFLARTSVARHFDRSLTARLTKLVRRKALMLSTRVIGVFGLTFGLYSFLIAMLLTLFTEYTADLHSIFTSIAFALCSLPLLFSKGNVSTALTGSAAGEVICDYLNIRKETLLESGSSGHISIAFVLGILASAATLVLPFGTIVCAIALAIMVCIILCTPEAGLTFSVVLLFITDIKLQYLIIGATAVSYLFKIIRSKRKITFRRTDLIFSIFALATLGAVVFKAEDSEKAGAMSYVLLLVPYFLCVFLLRDCKKIIKLLCAAILCAGALSAIYNLGFAVEFFAPLVGAASKSFLIDAARAFPAFESGFAPPAFSALIPVATAFIIKPKNKGYRFTLILCLASMISCLVITENLACLLAVFCVTAVLLLTTGSRKIYLSLSAFLTAAVVLSFAGSLGDRVYRYVYEHIYEAYHQAENLGALFTNPISSDYIISGHGFTDAAFAGKNFYYSLVSQLGITGLVILAAFILFVFGQAVRVIARAYRTSTLSDGIGYLSKAENRDETRMGMLAVICSLCVTLLNCTFIDIYDNSLSYMLFFVLCGVCVAFARSANLEFLKTSGSVAPKCSAERATVSLKDLTNGRDKS